MPSFAFRVIEATLTTGVGEDIDAGRWQLGVWCEVDKKIRGKDRKNVGYFRSGGTFKPEGYDAKYIEALAEKGMITPPKEAVIGMLHWFNGHDDDAVDGTPQSLLFDVCLPQEQLNELIKMARAGRYPTKLSIDTPFQTSGLKYGWEPDASSVEWDTEAHPRIPITGASITYKLVQPIEEPETDVVAVSERLGTPVAAELLPVLRQMRSHLGWAVLAIVVLIAVVWFRR